MKLWSLIPEVTILCVKLHDSRPPQAIFFEKCYFFVSGVCSFSTRTLPPLQNFEVQTLVPPLIPKKLLPTPFNPKSLIKSSRPLLQGGWRYDRRSKRYKYSSWKGGSICLESNAESCEYMLIYFWGMGTYFFWWDGNIYLLGGGGGWVEIFEGMNPPWICTPVYILQRWQARPGKKTPPGGGGEAPDSIEQGAKPPVRWMVEKRDARKTFSKELKTCQRCYTRLCKLWKSGIWKTNFRRELRLETLQFLPLVYV